MRRLALVLLLAALAALNGCAYSAYGLYDDQRLMDTITDDKTLATSIKTALMNENFSGGWSIAVYSYYGNVFLVGEVPQNMQGKALAIARRYKPRSVTPHWFSPAKSDTSNFALAASLRTDLIGAKGRPPPVSTRRSMPGAWFCWAWSRTTRKNRSPSVPRARSRA